MRKCRLNNPHSVLPIHFLWLTLKSLVAACAQEAFGSVYAWLGICRLPSYWSTRNRSIDKRPTWQQSQWRATGSFVNGRQVNARSALPFVKVGWCVLNDRFLVLQYEGVWPAPSRPRPRYQLPVPALQIAAHSRLSSPATGMQNPYAASRKSATGLLPKSGRARYASTCAAASAGELNCPCAFRSTKRAWSGNESASAARK